MSFIRNPNSAEDIDLHGAGDLMTHVNITDQERDYARALLARHGALDVAAMLGLEEVAV